MEPCFVCGHTTPYNGLNPIVFCHECLPDVSVYTGFPVTRQGGMPAVQEQPPLIPTPEPDYLPSSLGGVYSTIMSALPSVHIEVPLGTHPAPAASSSQRSSTFTADVPEGLAIVKDKVASDTKLEASIKRRRRPRFGSVRSTAPAIVCEICGQTFTKRHNLTSHITSHYGVKRFMCSLCGKYFSRKTDCQRHERDYCKQRPQGSGL